MMRALNLRQKHYAYVKISEGCNHRCAFLYHPKLSGDLVSRPIDSIMTEAAALKNAGVKELLIISQDTSAYGVNLKYKKPVLEWHAHQIQIYDMCEALNRLGIWVRLHYIYPYRMSMLWSN